MYCFSGACVGVFASGRLIACVGGLALCGKLYRCTSMDQESVTLGHEHGRLFAGEFVGSVCSVPASAVRRDGSLDAVTYQRQWARLNVRLNPGLTIGSHLFPLLEGPPPLDADRERFLSDAAAFL